MLHTKLEHVSILSTDFYYYSLQIVLVKKKLPSDFILLRIQFYFIGMFLTGFICNFYSIHIDVYSSFRTFPSQQHSLFLRTKRWEKEYLFSTHWVQSLRSLTKHMHRYPIQRFHLVMSKLESQTFDSGLISLQVLNTIPIRSRPRCNTIIKPFRIQTRITVKPIGSQKHK